LKMIKDIGNYIIRNLKALEEVIWVFLGEIYLIL
jgi:hypothetical protein